MEDIIFVLFDMMSAFCACYNFARIVETALHKKRA